MMPEPDDPARIDSERDAPLWPLSPKMQIVVVVAAIGLLNCLFIAIFVAAFFLQSS